MKVSLIVFLANFSHLTVCFIWNKALMTESDVVTLLRDTATERFINGFNNSYQRWIITQQLSNCPYVPLCGFTFGLRGNAFMSSCCKRCDCNFPLCMTQNSCCPDVIFQNIYVANDTIITKEELELLTGMDTQKTCMRLVWGNDGEKTRIEGVYAYTSCPRGPSKQMEQNCTRAYTTDDSDIENFSDIVPVLNKVTKELYRNKYCAYCHDIFDSEIQPLMSQISCNLNHVTHFKSEKDVIIATLGNKLCTLEFIPEVRLERCTLAISKCNTTGLWMFYDSHVERACGLFTSTIVTNNGSFQNIFCKECNGFVEPNLQCDTSFANPESDDFSFSGLLKLRMGDSAERARSTTLSCSANQLYDKLLRECRDIFCSVIMTLSHGKCVNIYERIEETSYEVLFRIKPIQKMSMYEAHEVADQVLYNLTRSLFAGQICSMQVLLQSGILYFEDNIDSIGNSSLLYYDARIKFYVGMFHDPQDVTEHIFKRQNFSIFSLNDSFEMRVRDGDPRPFDIVALISETIEENTDALELFGPRPLSDLIRDYASPGVNKLAVVPYPMGISHMSSCPTTQTPLNVLWLKPCPKLKISRSDFPWIEHEDGLIIQHGNYKLASEDFYYADDDNIVVCSESYKDFMSKVPSLYKLSFSVETIISISCSSLSIISLIITFVAFSILSQLRQTIPGKNSMSLVFYLLCAQCLYMMKSLSRWDKNSTECILMGMSVHLFWLVALFWMNNCTFHMFRVLSKTKVISHDSGMKRLVLYHIYALGMAAIFVSINSIASYYISGHMGYGGSVCYISTQEMINYTFVIPTTFVVVSNILMFLIVIFKIKRISSVQKNVQNERNDILVFVKLSTITGATWAFGILYTWTDVIAFSYLFIVLNAFQGVFIMLAFIVNKRVYDLLKSKTYAFTSTSKTTAVTSSTNVSRKL